MSEASGKSARHYIVFSVDNMKPFGLRAADAPHEQVGSHQLDLVMQGGESRQVWLRTDPPTQDNPSFIGAAEKKCAVLQKCDGRIQ